MHWILLTLVVAAGFAATASISYLLILLIAAACAKRSSTLPTDYNSGPVTGTIRFAVMIPAHDEELVIASTLDSLAVQTYPQSFVEVVVVADNCTDTTAEIARSSGATVLERFNKDLRGKGYALDWALTQLLQRSNKVDAVVIVDADTWVAPDFLQIMAGRLASDADAEGLCALQGRYGSLNTDDSWRAALMAAALDLFNHVKPLGRDWLGLTVGLKGNGMAFTRQLLEKAHWRGDSVTEDIDYGLDLARYHNLNIGYVPNARVMAQMPTNANQAASQRERWEGGRYKLLRERALPLLIEGLRRRNIALCDIAVDLFIPPLAELGLLTVVFGGLVSIGTHTHLLAHRWIWATIAFYDFLGLIIYIIAGLGVADAPPSAYRALLKAPVYAIWKICLYAVKPIKKLTKRGASKDEAEWVRTARAPISTSVSGKPPVSSGVEKLPE
jgi:1,2-diacylglycerol 3-beta-glucosyltransferase